MTATIHYLKTPLREVPTQEIRSIYEDLYLEEIRKQQEIAMKNDDFDPRLFSLVVLPFWSFIAFLIGYVVGGL